MLAREIAEMNQSGRLGITVDRQGRDRILRLVAEEPAPRLSAVVGDALHNFRSALDCIALAACERAAGRKLKDAEERTVQFPITDLPTNFRKEARSQLAFLDEVERGVFEQQQCFYWLARSQDDATAGSEEQMARIAEEARYDPLSQLREMSNQDKHRRLHLVAFFPKDIGSGVPTDVETSWQWARQPPAQTGDEIGRWSIIRGDPELELEHFGTVDLAFRRAERIEWETPVVQVLRGIEHRVTQACDSVERALALM